MTPSDPLRIGDLAELAGTSIRTIRHYHAEGLLPEPARDASGHRRYGAAELITLLRIRRLRDLGVPLRDVRITDAAGLHALLRDLEQDLEEQQRQLDQRRARVAELRRSIDPELPPALARYFEELARAGIAAELIAREKETALLMLTLAPSMAERLLGLHASLVENETAMMTALDMMRRFDTAAPGPVDPAQVEHLVRQLSDVTRDLPVSSPEAPGVRAAAMVFMDHLRSYSAAQQELITIVSARAGSACPDATSGWENSAVPDSAVDGNGGVLE
jgi:DNA-binding transcriptional MerR regulator